MKTTLLAFYAAGLTFTSAADPSLKAVPSENEKGAFQERYRILTDLDGDGVDDLLLSESPNSGGNMGVGWNVYLNRGGDFRLIGDITAHPKAIAFEPDKGRIAANSAERHHARIWVYLRGGGGAGSFGYFRAGESKVERLQKLELYPDSSDLGKGIYTATFTKSPIPFRLETSLTDSHGTVQWKPVISP